MNAQEYHTSSSWNGWNEKDDQCIDECIDLSMKNTFSMKDASDSDVGPPS